ncbi:response regulator [bacterium]|nr:response regulator [bacterium]
MKVLIVEDEFINRRLMGKMFEEIAFCEFAIDGNEAIEMVKLSIEGNQSYDLVCMDIMMPEKDGVQALEEIRQFEMSYGINPEDNVKIIMTTAKSDAQTIFSTFRMGCESYIVKPVTKDKLAKEMRKLDLID